MYKRQSTHCIGLMPVVVIVGSGTVVLADKKIRANFPNEIITKIERKSTGIEVELANDFSLKFNKKGQFVSLDD